MNKKIYKGLEIMEMISKGKIAEHQKFKFENNNFDGDVEYYNGTLYWLIYDEEWNLKEKRNLLDIFNIQSTMVADFEILEDNTEEIEELFGYRTGENDLYNDNFDDMYRKINELRKEKE